MVSLRLPGRLSRLHRFPQAWTVDQERKLPSDAWASQVHDLRSGCIGRVRLLEWRVKPIFVTSGAGEPDESSAKADRCGSGTPFPLPSLPQRPDRASVRSKCWPGTIMPPDSSHHCEDVANEPWKGGRPGSSPALCMRANRRAGDVSWTDRVSGSILRHVRSGSRHRRPAKPLLAG